MLNQILFLKCSLHYYFIFEQASLEEKTKRIHSLDNLLKSREQKILNLEQLVDEQQKEIR